MTIETKIEVDSRCIDIDIDIDGMNCSIACIATFANGKCNFLFISDMKNIEDYVKRY